MVKKSPARQEMKAGSLGQEDPMQKEMAAHSSVLSWRIPWTEEPGRLQSRGLRVRHDLVTKQQLWFHRPTTLMDLFSTKLSSIIFIKQ